jgi:hypothetical protein
MILLLRRWTLQKDLTNEEVDLTHMEVDDNEAEQDVEEMYSNDINETEAKEKTVYRRKRLCKLFMH